MTDRNDIDEMEKLRDELRKHLDLVLDFSGFTEKMKPKEAYVAGYQKAHEHLETWIQKYNEILNDMHWFVKIKKEMRSEIINELELCDHCDVLREELGDD